MFENESGNGVFGHLGLGAWASARLTESNRDDFRGDEKRVERNLYAHAPRAPIRKY